MDVTGNYQDNLSLFFTGRSSGNFTEVSYLPGGGYFAGAPRSAIASGLDGNPWCFSANMIVNGAYQYNTLEAATPTLPLFSRAASAWNSESALIRIQVMQWRAEDRNSLVANLANARYVRLNSYEPEQVIHLGTEQWKVFPFFKKNGDFPGDVSGYGDTGTFGWALRYDV